MSEKKLPERSARGPCAKNVKGMLARKRSSVRDPHAKIGKGRHVKSAKGPKERSVSGQHEMIASGDHVKKEIGMQMMIVTLRSLNGNSVRSARNPRERFARSMATREEEVLEKQRARVARKVRSHHIRSTRLLRKERPRAASARRHPPRLIQSIMEEGRSLIPCGLTRSLRITHSHSGTTARQQQRLQPWPTLAVVLQLRTLITSCQAATEVEMPPQ
mmetsp:Transcript_64119/g.113769  ORF Transcript_64119/g.113769 Transcript_64119/m.113769 type:complete len:217 (-) Transcript_64119:98-748(-)